MTGDVPRSLLRTARGADCNILLFKELNDVDDGSN